MALDRLLLVEDNHEFILNAVEGLSDKPQFHLAIDYEKAIYALDTLQLDGALIDCFFPKATASDDTSLLDSALDKLIESNPMYHAIEDYMNSLGQFVDINNEKIRIILRNIGRFNIHEGNNDPRNLQLYRSLERACRHLGKDRATANFLKISQWAEDDREFDQYGKDSIEDIRKKVKEDPSNQPLGILVAEHAHEKGVPFILTTSVNHHCSIVQPVRDYCKNHGYSLMFEKSNPGFWQKAYNELERKVRGGSC